MHQLEARWRAFLEAFRGGDAESCLPALQRWIEEWDRCFWAADFTAFAAIYDPEFRSLNRARLPIGFDVQGPAGFQRLRSEAADVASRFWFDVQACHRWSDDHFAGLGRFRARGRYTRLLLQAPLAVVWTLRGDRILQAEAYMSHREALRSSPRVLDR